MLVLQDGATRRALRRHGGRPQNVTRTGSSALLGNELSRRRRTVAGRPALPDRPMRGHLVDRCLRPAAASCPDHAGLCQRADRCGELPRSRPRLHGEHDREHPAPGARHRRGVRLLHLRVPGVRRGVPGRRGRGRLARPGSARFPAAVHRRDRRRGDPDRCRRHRRLHRGRETCVAGCLRDDRAARLRDGRPQRHHRPGARHSDKPDDHDADSGPDRPGIRLRPRRRLQRPGQPGGSPRCSHCSPARCSAPPSTCTTARRCRSPSPPRSSSSPSPSSPARQARTSWTGKRSSSSRRCSTSPPGHEVERPGRAASRDARDLRGAADRLTTRCLSFSRCR